MSIAIIVPTLNEAENVLPLVARIEECAPEFSEIIFVDDGSTDGTREEIRVLGESHRVRLLNRDGASRGLAGAIIAGAESTAADVLVVMDADLSHPPEKIVELLQPIETGEIDLVIGSRYVAGGTTPGWPLWRRALSRTASLLARPLTGAHDSMCGFFAIRREVLFRFASTAAGFKIVFEILVRGRRALRFREVPIVFRDRERGCSKMSIQEGWRFAGHWLRALAKRIFLPAPVLPLPVAAQEPSQD